MDIALYSCIMRLKVQQFSDTKTTIRSLISLGNMKGNERYLNRASTGRVSQNYLLNRCHVRLMV